MAIGIRGINPIWWLPDLDGNPLDDTYFLFILSNDIPYVPLPVFSDDNLLVPLTNPIQFLGNGTLPVDIFYNPTLIYRLEIRQGDTQQDPLIYLIENYVPGTGEGTITTNAAFPTNNQITNPQFSLVSFASPFSLTGTDPDPIEVAPGWFLNLTGTGTVTLNQIPLNNASTNPTNASYALNIILTGDWMGAFLSQRFQQNGMLWSGKTVSSSVTARLQGDPQAISGQFVDSNATTLGVISYENSGLVNSSFSELKGFLTLPSANNPDLPPAAFIEFQLLIPTTVNLFLTSFQLISGELKTNYFYEQETIERQIDNTFHYYKDSILMMPKESILTGWDFGLNPWQFTATTPGNLANNSYIADQTIIVQQNYVDTNAGNNISVGQNSVGFNEGVLVFAVTATNKFAMIQYIDPSTTIPYWNFSKLSALVKIGASRNVPSANQRIKMNLIYRTTLPAAVSRTEPIASWDADGQPVYAAGWTVITPENDPSYNLVAGQNTLSFNGFTLPISTSGTMVLGVVLYMVDAMDASDNLTIQKVSLVPNDFAIDCNALSFDETLRRCQFYYEKSYNQGILPGTVDSSGLISAKAGLFQTGTNQLVLSAATFDVDWLAVKRASPSIITFYSPVTGASGVVNTQIWSANTLLGSLDVTIGGGWTLLQNSMNNSTWFPINRTTSLLFAVSAVIPDGRQEGLIFYHYTADARLGV